jgi:hypothetical protein
VLKVKFKDGPFSPLLRFDQDFFKVFLVGVNALAVKIESKVEIIITGSQHTLPDQHLVKAPLVKVEAGLRLVEGKGV